MGLALGMLGLDRRAPTRAAGRARAAWDPVMVIVVGSLLMLGVLMVYSASVSIATRGAGYSTYYLIRHAISIGIGLMLALILVRIPIRVWERGGPLLLVGGIVLLIAVLIPGIGARINGSSRWIPLGIANFQPSELVKLAMVVYVSGYLVRKQDSLHRFSQGILMVGIVLAVIGMLLLQEPDLGAVVVISGTVLAMLFLGGVRFLHFTAVVGAALGGMLLLTVLSPYRMARVTGFLDPWADPFDSGFQLTQALIAFGRGEWFGVGLGASVQKLFYLPAAHTDFLFAVIAEELGLLAVLGVIALFGALIWRAFGIARQAELSGYAYGARLAQGLGLLLGLQAMINMGVNMGVLPTKGLTLPFVSYGGSSMLVSCMAAALLLRIERETRREAGGAV